MVTAAHLRNAGSRVGNSPLLPAVGAFIAVAITVGVLQPDSLNYQGASLLLTYTVPLALACLAQMVIMGVGDIDLGVGSFIGLVNALTVTVLARHAALGVLTLVGCVLGYMAMGALIELRGLPPLIVTLGANFVWAGAAIVVLPSPGGTAPNWIVSVVNYHLPVVPLPVAVLVVAAGTCSWIMASPPGVMLRGMGGDVQAVRNAGLSSLLIRVCAYGFAGLIAILAGITISGDITSGDSTVSASYTLLSIAAVILGGGDFSGGRVSAVGTVLGATTLGLLGSILTFVNVPSTYQVGLEGLMLLVILLIRWVRSSLGRLT